MLGVAGAARGRAGVAAPVGGCEARADAGAWGVGAPDIIIEAQEGIQSCRAKLVLSLPARDDAPVRRAGLKAGLLIGVGDVLCHQGLIDSWRIVQRHVDRRIMRFVFLEMVG